MSYIKQLVKDKALTPDEKLFPLTTKRMQERLKAFIGSVTGKAFTSHDIRHTFVHQHVKSGTDPAVIASLIGHTGLHNVAHYMPKFADEDYI